MLRRSWTLTFRELRKVLTRAERSGLSSTIGSAALFIAYLILAIPVGAAFVFMVILSLPIWALTKDERRFSGSHARWPIESL